ncbi:MAG: hypothetical protein U0Z75_07660 [Deinococcaceae bacterium]
MAKVSFCRFGWDYIHNKNPQLSLSGHPCAMDGRDRPRYWMNRRPARHKQSHLGTSNTMALSA